MRVRGDNFSCWTKELLAMKSEQKTFSYDTAVEEKGDM